MVTFAALLERMNQLGIAITIDPQMKLTGPVAQLGDEYVKACRAYRNDLIRVALARDLLIQADLIEYPHDAQGARLAADEPACLAAAIEERMLRWEALLVAPRGVRWSVVSRRMKVRRPGVIGPPPHPKDRDAVIADHDETTPELLRREREALPRLPQGQIHPNAILEEGEDPEPEELSATRRAAYLGVRVVEDELEDPEIEEIPA
jgi:hypothetical protein